MIEVTIHNPIVGVDKLTADGKVRIRFVLPKRPFLFWVEKKINEDFNLPPGYGIAWRDWGRPRFLYATMPFNVVIGFTIWVYHWVRGGASYFFYRTSKCLGIGAPRVPRV